MNFEILLIKDFSNYFVPFRMMVCYSATIKSDGDDLRRDNGLVHKYKLILSSPRK
ncbi:MAG: hypothetical protein O6940_11150 [Ignavibacteria bacterium]|nr:hypothetical protein [Ignavibacteria bacterium]